MTKNELLDIQNFIKDMLQSDDDIEVLNRIYFWLKAKYEEQGAKIGEQYINFKF